MKHNQTFLTMLHKIHDTWNRRYCRLNMIENHIRYSSSSRVWVQTWVTPQKKFQKIVTVVRRSVHNNVFDDYC